MTNRLRNITAIIVKDAVALWPVVAAAAVLVIGSTLFSIKAPQNGMTMFLGGILNIIAVLGSVIAFVLTVQNDPAMGLRHDWRTRPIRRLDLVAAKYLFLLPAVFLPWLITGVIRGIDNGYSLAEVLLANSDFTLLLVALPLLIAFAATAETLLGFMVMVGITIAAALAGMWVFQDLVLAPLGALMFDPLRSWISEVLLGVTLLALGGGLLWYEYNRHRVWLSRAALLLGVFTLVLINAYAVPAGPVWAAYKGAYPESAGANDVNLEIERACLSSTLDTDNANAAAFIKLDRDFEAAGHGQLRTRVTGLEPDERLVLGVAGVSIGPGAGEGDIGKLALRGGGGVLGPTASAQQVLFVPDETMMNAMRETGVSAHAQMTLVRQTGRFEFPADGVRRRVDGFGWCSAEKGPLAVMVDCFNPGSQPDLIEFSDPSGRARCSDCAPSFAPAVLQLLGGRRYSPQVILMPGAEIEKVVVTSYDAVSRFERQVVSAASAAGQAPCIGQTPTAEQLEQQREQSVRRSTTTTTTIQIGG